MFPSFSSFPRIPHITLTDHFRLLPMLKNVKQVVYTRRSRKIIILVFLLVLLCCNLSGLFSQYLHNTLKPIVNQDIEFYLFSIPQVIVWQCPAGIKGINSSGTFYIYWLDRNQLKYSFSFYLGERELLKWLTILVSQQLNLRWHSKLVLHLCRRCQSHR